MPGPSTTPKLAALLGADQRVALERRVALMERQVAALPERPMRRALLVGVFQALNEQDLVGVLVLLVHRVAEGLPGARLLLQEVALDEEVLSGLPYARTAAAYEVARTMGAEGVARMFLSARHRSNLSVEESNRDNEHLSLPLGVRRSAARTSNRLLLDRLLHDRDPRVIALLLDNPRVVERDVVRVAAMRPTWPEVLTVVARHPRWSSNYRVRKALAANPYTPRPVALRLLPTLLVQDLRLVLQTVDLDPRVAEDIRALLAARGGRAGRAAEALRRDPGLSEEVDALIASAFGEEEALDERADVAAVGGADAPLKPFEEEGADELEEEIEALMANYKRQGRAGWRKVGEE